VLRHGDLGVNPPERCDRLIRFADFEKTVADLCRCLRPGAYLIIWGSNFRFADTASASGFDTVFSPHYKKAKDTPPLSATVGTLAPVTVICPTKERSFCFHVKPRPQGSRHPRRVAAPP
jgi:hypothetical protein